MTLHQVTVYHNHESRFLAYQDGHRLSAAVSHWLHLPVAASLEAVADWAFHVFNADLDNLEHARTKPSGELAFLAACVYRLLGLRSLSVGDVVHVAADRHEWWLACDHIGWQQISPPSNVHGQPLTAEKIYRQLRAQRDTR